MKPHAAHLRIARLVVDGAVVDAMVLSRDPDRLAAAIAAQLQGGLLPARGRSPTWPGAVADAVADRLVAAGLPPARTGGWHGNV